MLCIFKIDACIPLWTQTLKEVFSGKKPNVSHFRVFGCPVYFHVPKEKRSKLDASGKKGMFVGYSETSKAYRIYVPGQREVEICHDVTFDEDAALKKVRNLPSSKEDKEEEEAGRQEESKDEPIPNVEGPMDPIDPPPSNKKRPSWLRDTLADVKRHIAPRGTFRESKKPDRYQGYLAAMSTIV